MLVTSYYYTVHVYGDTSLRRLYGMCFSYFDLNFFRAISLDLPTTCQIPVK
jgi:hypothetical protein